MAHQELVAVGVVDVELLGPLVAQPAVEDIELHVRGQVEVQVDEVERAGATEVLELRVDGHVEVVGLAQVDADLVHVDVEPARRVLGVNLVLDELFDQGDRLGRQLVQQRLVGADKDVAGGGWRTGSP
jgi:hypothetical protein